MSDKQNNQLLSKDDKNFSILDQKKDQFLLVKKITSKTFEIIALIAGIFCWLFIPSPIDAVPDLIPVLGWIDDIFYGIVGFIFYVIFKIFSEISKKLSDEKPSFDDPDFDEE